MVMIALTRSRGGCDCAMHPSTAILYIVVAIVGTVVTIACVRVIWLAVGAYRINRAGPRPLFASSHAIWRDPGDVAVLDLVNGPGGPSGVPRPPFQFMEEHTSGSQPCVSVRDAAGRRWRVKWGNEVRSENFAVRVAWACGYFAETTYFVEQGEIAGSCNLQRAHTCINEHGRFREARFELDDPNVRKLFEEHSWAWNDNPFVGTRQLHGLKIVVMFKPENPNDLLAPDKNTRWLTVVGVVGETKMAGLVTTDDRVGTYYFPLRQASPRGLTLTVRTAGDPLAVAPSVREQLRAVDPELPLYSVRTMTDRMNESLADRRTPMVVALVFAVVALFLAAVGLYGVLAYQVSQRTREIGIRLALGSDSRRVFGLIVKEGMTLMAAGFGVGMAGAFAIRRTMAAQLYGVGPMDPVVLACVATVLALVTLAACTLPARRAARIDPIVALSDQ